MKHPILSIFYPMSKQHINQYPLDKLKTVLDEIYDYAWETNDGTGVRYDGGDVVCHLVG